MPEIRRFENRKLIKQLYGGGKEPYYPATEAGLNDAIHDHCSWVVGVTWLVNRPTFVRVKLNLKWWSWLTFGIARRMAVRRAQHAFTRLVCPVCHFEVV